MREGHGPLSYLCVHDVDVHGEILRRMRPSQLWKDLSEGAEEQISWNKCIHSLHVMMYS